MRKLLLAAVGAVAMSATSVASAAITVPAAGGTIGSSAGSTITISALDNSGFPETFNFDTSITGGAGTYTSFFDFSNDLSGFYIFSVTTSILNGQITIDRLLDSGAVQIAQTTGSGNALSLQTPVLTPGAMYRFTYTSQVPGNGHVSGNASFYLPVPEPATWAMMLVGFAGIGMAMRRRRQPALAQLA